VSTTELPFTTGSGGYGLGLQNQERSIVRSGDALVFSSSAPIIEADQYVGERAAIEVVDLSEPGAPAHAGTLARPDGIAHGALQQQGDELYSWHMRAVDGDTARVRFYFDRFDVSSPSEPDALAPVNVPGQVVAFDDASDRVVAVGFQREEIDEPEQGCWSHPKSWGHDYDSDTCYIAHRPLHLLQLVDGGAALLDTLDVEGDATRLSAVMASEDRVFALVTEREQYYWDDEGGVPQDYEPPTDTLAVVTGHHGDDLREGGRVVLDRGGWTTLLGVTGTRATYRSNVGLGFVDASDANAPETTLAETLGWGCYDALVTEDAVYCPLGEYGLQVIPTP
ncbi:MAG: hypothetical protein IAG13_14710, partial [Deltaproteobacteria bacterium]|nr:hypothetical protein [Nannocystaceae bacterium]